MMIQFEFSLLGFNERFPPLIRDPLKDTISNSDFDLLVMLIDKFLTEFGPLQTLKHINNSGSRSDDSKVFINKHIASGANASLTADSSSSTMHLKDRQGPTSDILSDISSDISSDILSKFFRRNSDTIK
jgi:hypothetical protein